MKNLFTLLLIVLLSNFSLTAQNNIEGGISTETGESVTAATITLVNEQEANLSKTMLVDEDGYFMVDNLADGNYKLVVEHTAYKTITMDNFVFPRDNDQILGLTMEALENTEISVAQNTPDNNHSIAKIYK